MRFLERIFGWFLDRFGMSFDDGQSTSPPCATCSHSFDEHPGTGRARPCAVSGCTCRNYVADWKNS